MQEALMTITKLEGVAVTIVTNGELERCGWLLPLHEALLSAGAVSVDVQGWANALSRSTLDALQRGAESVERSLKKLIGAADDSELSAAAPESRRLLLFDTPESLHRHERLDISRSQSVRVGLVWSRQGCERWRGSPAQGFLLADPSLRALLDRADLPDLSFSVVGPVLPQPTLQPPPPASLESLGLAGLERPLLLDATTLTPQQFAQVLDGVKERGALNRGLLVWDADIPELSAQIRDIASRSGVQVQRFGAEHIFEALIPSVDAIIISARSRWWPILELGGHPTLWLWPDVSWRPAALRPNEAAAFNVQQIRDGLAIIDAAGRPSTELNLDAQRRFSSGESVAALRALVDAVASHTLTPKSPPSATVGGAPTAGPATGSVFEVVGSGVTPATPRPAPQTHSDLKRELAELLLQGRRLKGELDEAIQERDLWMKREVLAAEQGISDLQAVAADRASQAIASIELLRSNIEANQTAQRQLRASRGGPVAQSGWANSGTPQPADEEARFRELELAKGAEVQRSTSAEGYSLDALPKPPAEAEPPADADPDTPSAPSPEGPAAEGAAPPADEGDDSGSTPEDSEPADDNLDPA